MMKKIFALPALALLSVGLASCGGNSDNAAVTANEGAILNADGALADANAVDDLTFGNETAAPAGANEFTDNATADNGVANGL